MLDFNTNSQKSKALELKFISSFIILFLLSLTLILPECALAADKAPPRKRQSNTKGSTNKGENEKGEKATLAEKNAKKERIAKKKKNQERMSKACDEAKDQIQAIQQKLFSLKGKDSEPSFQELLKEKDKLSAKKSMIEGLINLWDNYYSYLDDNQKFKTEEKKTKKDVNKLINLRNHISKHAKEVQKYQLVTDIFKSLDMESMTSGSLEINFKNIKNKLKQSCQNAQSHLMHCQIANNSSKAGVDIWNQIQPGTAPAPGDTSRAAMLHKFVEVSSTALQNKSTTWLKDLASLFIDDEKLNYDIVKKDALSQSVLSTLDRVIKVCRKESTKNPSAQNCMDQNLRNIAPQGHSSDHIALIQKHLGPKINSAQDILDNYLLNADSVSEGHEGLARLSQQRAAQSVAKFTSTGGQPSKDQKDTMALEVAKLERHYNVLKNNDELYQINNETGSLKKMNLSKTANNQLKNILDSLTGEDNPIEKVFSMSPGSKPGTTRLTSTPGMLKNFFEKNHITKESLQKLLSKNEHGESLNQAISNIDNKIAKLKKNSEYYILNGLKNFAWDEVINKCRGVSDHDTLIVDNSKCVASSYSELDNLMQVGNKLVAYQSKEYNRYNIDSLSSNCKRLKGQKNTTYTETYSSICREINQKISFQEKEDARNTPRAIHKRAQTDKVKDASGKIVTKTKPSWGKSFAAALKISIPSITGYGQAWVGARYLQTNMNNLVSYTKYRYNYLQAQYDLYSSSCSTGNLFCYNNSYFSNSFGTTYASSAFTPNTMSLFL